MITWFIIIFILSLTVLMVYIVAIYNRLITLTQSIDESWGNITVALQKRHALIPRLISLANISIAYEADILASVTALRSGNIAQAAKAERQVEKTILTVKEDYPELKTSMQFTVLMKDLSKIENTIRAERLIFNKAVALYNREIRSFPSQIVAYMFGFISTTFLSFDELSDDS
ncbi:MAG: LemA family protein [Candidatus Saccharimonadales bacterium]